MPASFWYMVNAFQPIEGVKGVKPSLYPNYAQFIISEARWYEVNETVSVSDDPSAIGLWNLCIAELAKRLKKDVCVNSLTSDSLLDSGVLLTVRRCERGFTSGQAVSPRKLSRRDEIVTVIINQRLYRQLSPVTQVYLPELDAGEETAYGMLVCYAVSDRPVEARHVLNELFYPEVAPRG